MIKALIIDDEAFARELLKQQLEAYCPEVEVIGLAGTAIDGLKLINQLKPGLVFLDVEMPMGNGFDLLELAGDRHFEVIFTTAHQEYALKAIKNRAVDYLLKPIGENDLVEAVKKVVSPAGSLSGDVSRHQKLKLHGLKETLMVQVSDVLYLEADGRYCKVYLAGGARHMVTRNIGEFEEELVPQRFFRIHKSLLVNLAKVTLLHQEKIELEEGIVLPISKRRQSSVAALLKGRAG